MTCSSPNKVFTNSAEHSAKKVSKEKKRKASEEVKQQRQKSKYSRTDESSEARKAYSRHDGGLLPDEVDDDNSPEHLEKLKKSYETKVVVTPQEILEIERNTCGQTDSERWIVERRRRITASVVGGIAKMRAETKKSKKVENLLYSKFKGNAATRYGSVTESRAVHEYTTYQQQHGHPDLKVEKCVSLSDPWLAATPDGLVWDSVGDDASQYHGLLEIKNPHSLRDQTFLEGTRKSSFCLEKDESRSSFRLKPRHDYYHQNNTGTVVLHQKILV